jgi:hypothetical protein
LRGEEARSGAHGLDRFLGETAIFYFLYTRNLAVEPATPPLAVAGARLAGDRRPGGRCAERQELPAVRSPARPQAAVTVENSYPTPAGAVSAKGNPAVIDASRVVFAYEGQPRLTLIHLLEIGDGPPPAAAPAAQVEFRPAAVELLLEKKTYRFSATPLFDVSLGAL